MVDLPLGTDGSAATLMARLADMSRPIVVSPGQASVAAPGRDPCRGRGLPEPLEPHGKGVGVDRGR